MSTLKLRLSTRPAAGGRARAALLGAGLFIFAACGGPGGEAPAASTQPGEVSTEVTEDTTITLFTAAGLRDYQQGLADAFTQAHPNITVELQVEADNNYNTVLPRLLASDNPPDLAGPADLIGHVRDGLVTNLDTYDEAYGWSEEVPSTVLDAGRVSEGSIGSGSLYQAGGAAGPIVGVFYNRDLAEQVGMTEIPASLAELERVLAKAKAQGITPIVASNGDGLVGHLYNLLLAAHMGPQDVLDVVWRSPGASLDTSEAVEATAVLQRWAGAGYFNSDANAINQDASYGRFASGKGLFMFQGTWITQSLPGGFDGEYGIFPMPPLEEGDGLSSMTGNTLAFSIAANSEAKDAAALFLDFLTTPEAAAVAAENGYPSAASADAPELSLEQEVADQIQAGYSRIAQDNGFFSWIQNSVPAVNTELPTQLQLILEGRTEPQSVVAELQDAYESGL
jgi:raffinose/stachyose/melibiose transport system substrate-binding protein